MPGNSPGCIITPPPGTTGAGGKDSTYCKAYRAGLDAWCKDEGNRGGKDFNSYVFDELKKVDPPLYNAIRGTREVPIGAIVGGSATPLSQLGGGAAGRMMNAVIAFSSGSTTFMTGLMKSKPWLARLILAGKTRSILRRGGLTSVDRVLCPDGRTPSGTPIEIKRPSEPTPRSPSPVNVVASAPRAKDGEWPTRRHIGSTMSYPTSPSDSGS